MAATPESIYPDLVDPFFVAAVIVRFTVPIDGYNGHTHTIPTYGDPKGVAEALRDGNFTVSIRTTHVVEEQV